MKQKVLQVNSIKPLTDGPNGQKRFTLKESKSDFCVFINDGTTKQPVVGDKVVALEREITLKDGSTATGWYFEKEFTTANLKADVNRDYGHVVALQQKLQLARVEAGAIDLVD